MNFIEKCELMGIVLMIGTATAVWHFPGFCLSLGYVLFNIRAS